MIDERVPGLQALLEDHSQWKIELAPAQRHPINPIRMEQYLAACEEEIRDSMRTVLQQIKRISYDEFVCTVHENIDQILSQAYVPLRWFFFSSQQNKSPTWVAMHIMHYISQYHEEKGVEMFFIRSLNDERIKEDDLVIFADDCGYSGEEFKFVLSDAFESYDHAPLFNVLLFLPYMSDYARAAIEKVIRVVKTKAKTFQWCPFSEVISTIPLTTLSYTKMSALSHYFPYTDCHFPDEFMVYFDHKISVAAPIIFRGVVACRDNQNVLYRNNGQETQQIIRVEFIENLNKDHTIDPPYKTPAFQAALSDIWEHMDQYSWT